MTLNGEEREALIAGLDALTARLQMARVRRGKGSIVEPSFDPMEARQLQLAQSLRDRIWREV